MHTDDPSSTAAPSTSESWLASLAAGLGSRTDRAHAWLTPGTVVDQTYRVERAVGAGGMAVVYLAHDLELDRSVALKAYDVVAKDVMLSRIYREARAMARLTHPNVLVVHGVGVHAGRVFLAMEYVTGGTLHDWLTKTERSVREIVEVFLQCARGLAAAHAVGVVHGDFKPANVLVGSDDRARVADFGLARLLDPSGEGTDEPRGFAGTMRYAAPEQRAGTGAVAQSDQFAFCVALFEALTGSHPFEGEDGSAIAASICEGRRRSGSLPRPLPRWLDRVLARGLAAAPTDRFATMNDLVLALERDPSRRNTRVIAVAAVATIGGVLAVAWPRASPCDGVAAGIDVAWNQAAAQTLTSAVVASSVPDAGTRAETIVQGLDAWVSRWRDQRVEACAATHERATQSAELLDRRMLCLDRQLVRLGAVIDVLGTGEREAVVGAIDAIAGLPEPIACGDAERLLAAVAPPDDERVEAAVAEQRIELAKAATALDLADEPGARSIADAVRSSDAAQEYAPLRAEAAMLVGQAQWRMLEHEAAEAALTDAYHTAIVAGDDELATRAARELVCDTGGVDGGLERARVWLTHATSLASRTNADELEQIELEVCHAVLRQAEGRADQAEVMLRAALERAVTVAPSGSLLPARIEVELGRAAVARSRYDEALAAFDRAAADVTRMRGPTNPLAFAIRAEIGRTLELAGRRDEGLGLALDTLRSFVALYGPESARVVQATRNVAAALSGLGRLPEEAEYLEKGIALGRKRGDQDRLVAQMLSALASNRALRGDEEGSVQTHREALELMTRARGPQHVEVAVLHQNFGAGLSRFLRMDEALREYQAALAILEPALGAEHADVGVVHLNLATATFHLGDRSAYARHLDRAEAIAEARRDPVSRAMVLASRCMALRADGDLQGSRDAMQKALEILGDAHAGSRRMYTYALGHDELALGHAEEAAQAFEEARALAVAADMPLRVAAADTELAKAEWMLGKKQQALERAERTHAALVELGDDEAAAALGAWIDERR